MRIRRRTQPNSNAEGTLFYNSLHPGLHDVRLGHFFISMWCHQHGSMSLSQQRHTRHAVSWIQVSPRYTSLFPEQIILCCVLTNKGSGSYVNGNMIIMERNSKSSWGVLLNRCKVFSGMWTQSLKSFSQSLKYYFFGKKTILYAVDA